MVWWSGCCTEDKEEKDKRKKRKDRTKGLAEKTSNCTLGLAVSEAGQR